MNRHGSKKIMNPNFNSMKHPASPTLRSLASSIMGIASLVPATARAADSEAPPLHDVVVYGDSSGAVTAAVSAKRQGRSVILVNPTRFLGGMSSSGLGATDFLGRRATFGGIASEFYDAVAAAYGTDFVRSFEPHVGRRVFDKIAADAGLTVVFDEKLDRTPGKGVKMNDGRIESITTLSGKTYRGKMFVDATYVGDLMAAAGVSFTVGREAEAQYGEDLAGVRRGDTKPRVHYTQRDKDHFIREVDPYVKAGDPSSGLLPRIHRIEGLANGQGDRKIQAYNYRVCLTTDPEAPHPDRQAGRLSRDRPRTAAPQLRCRRSPPSRTDRTARRHRLQGRLEQHARRRLRPSRGKLGLSRSQL
jgi:hypothetical protein